MPEVAPCAVCSAELTEVPVFVAWMAVQIACETFR
jgi:hypothetical protein